MIPVMSLFRSHASGTPDKRVGKDATTPVREWFNRVESPGRQATRVELHSSGVLLRKAAFHHIQLNQTARQRVSMLTRLAAGGRLLSLNAVWGTNNGKFSSVSLCLNTKSCSAVRSE